MIFLKGDFPSYSKTTSSRIICNLFGEIQFEVKRMVDFHFQFLLFLLGFNINLRINLGYLGLEVRNVVRATKYNSSFLMNIRLFDVF